MKTREIACKHYAAEGQCKLGKEGTFYKACQHCRVYSPLLNGRPARVNTKRQRLERIRRKEKFDY